MTTRPMQKKTPGARTRPTLMLGMALALGACASHPRPAAVDAIAHLSPEDQHLRHKYRGIHGVVLRLDATSRKEGVMVTSETGRSIDAPASLSLEKVDNLSYSGKSMPIPKTVRATWRVGKFSQNSSGNGWDGGTIVGDHTVPVAERIPDELLDYIRAHGGALRLLIRLKDDGILIGWDVEERIPKPNWKPDHGARNYLRYSLPGGDFREVR